MLDHTGIIIFFPWRGTKVHSQNGWIRTAQQ